MIPTLVLLPRQNLTINLADLGFCDSSGLTALLAARNHAHAAQSGFTLTEVPDTTLRFLALTGLDRVFDLRTGADAATGT
ncbi:STAS domain-containing protein [Streptomyces goshikiensis]|uniref:STAS domain-containing protein n=1 Tax=Streptomyces goshikiensis TaxID=1942 RepID=UPI003710EA2E